MSACLCDQCSGLCCRYFALPIDNPTDRRDYDNIRWYLLHQNVVIFIESKQWYIGILNRCRALQADNRCGIYLDRPAICRSYTTDNCDYHAGDYGYDQLFTSAESLWQYAKKTLSEERKAKWKKTKSKSKRKSKTVSRSTRARRLSKKLKLPGSVTQVEIPLSLTANGRPLGLPQYAR